MILLISCGQEANEKSENDSHKVDLATKNQDPPYKLISFQLHPSFHQRVNFIVNLADSSVVSYVPFHDSISYPPPPPKEYEDRYPYKEFVNYSDLYLKLDGESYSYLCDSIVRLIDTIDLASHSSWSIDGIGGEFVFIADSGRVGVATLSNAFTKNQFKLISFCLKQILALDLKEADRKLFDDLREYGYCIYPFPSLEEATQYPEGTSRMP